MAWLMLGAMLLLLAIPVGRGKAGCPPDAPVFASVAAFAASAWLALSVYSPGKVGAVVLAWAAGLGLLLLVGPRIAAPNAARWALLALGAASSLFALFGPADGLF